MGLSGNCKRSAKSRKTMSATRPPLVVGRKSGAPRIWRSRGRGSCARRKACALADRQEHEGRMQVFVRFCGLSRLLGSLLACFGGSIPFWSQSYTTEEGCGRHTNKGCVTHCLRASQNNLSDWPLSRCNRPGGRVGSSLQVPFAFFAARETLVGQETLVEKVGVQYAVHRRGRSPRVHRHF